jgi:hypothetical protein
VISDVAVKLFPSAAITRRSFCTTLPAFLSTRSMVRSSMRRIATVSTFGLPAIGYSFPSNFASYCEVIVFPSACSIVLLTFCPSGLASMVTVQLFGAGFRPNCDFAAFSFQVPDAGSACARSAANNATNMSPSLVRRRCILPHGRSP